MAKIGVIGDAQSVLGFKAFGLDVFACNTAQEAAGKLLDRLMEIRRKKKNG